jgi:hypothetical protein
MPFQCTFHDSLCGDVPVWVSIVDNMDLYVLFDLCRMLMPPSFKLYPPKQDLVIYTHLIWGVDGKTTKT